MTETENAAEMQPSAEVHEHTHEGHTHEHEPAQPTLNPELMREVAVEVDAETVSKAFKTVVKKYTRLARIPGFRVGEGAGRRDQEPVCQGGSAGGFG